MMTKPILPVMALMVLAACGETPDKFEKREARISSALEDNETIGNFGSDAVWLIKASSLAPDDRTAVFFGYNDNLAACRDIAATLEKAEFVDRYRCEPID